MRDAGKRLQALEAARSAREASEAQRAKYARLDAALRAILRGERSGLPEPTDPKTIRRMARVRQVLMGTEGLPDA